jgi:hypothetical protein
MLTGLGGLAISVARLEAKAATLSQILSVGSGALLNAVNDVELPAEAPLGHAMRARDCGEAVP